VQLTRSVRRALTRVTSGGAPVFIWPGGGITYMVDVATMPDNSFGYVPTPAIVGPIEFTMTRASYRALGGHVDQIRLWERPRSRDDLLHQLLYRLHGDEPGLLACWDFSAGDPIPAAADPAPAAAATDPPPAA
jgi:hypothetical protein